MGSRVLSRLSARRKRNKVPWQGNDNVVDVSAASRDAGAAANDSLSVELQLPLEIWLIIVDILASTNNGQCHLAALAQVCKELRYPAEEALYRRVSVGSHILQLRSFLHTVCESERRAAAVRALRMRVPSVVSSFVRPTVLQKLSRYSSRYTATASQAHYSVSAREAGNLSDVLAQALGRLVNLKELDFVDSNDLQAFPVLFAYASFQLTELRTTGNALSKAIVCLQARTTIGPEGSRRAPSPLATVEKLTVDVSTTSFYLPVSDLQILVALPNLLSLRIEWSSFQVFSNHVASVLWPTHVLGDEPMRRLRRLEVSEWRTKRPYRPMPADLNADVDTHFLRLRGLCPSITSLVWWPSEYHRHLAKTGAERPTRFCEALRRYTEGLFATWPTLECFERPKLESHDPVVTAFVRGQGLDDRVSDHPCVFSSDMWREV
ncbi:hypothetical protein C8T65DRAFT_669765 [Cerioporus squamosus]|nr:hypothetical protein C8T65DRAFT_669765 [Cerioporus squamosus]